MADIDAQTPQGRRRLILGGGAVAGAIGGVVNIILGLARNTARGDDLWPALKGAASPFLHGRAHAPGFDLGAVALGLFDHFAISVTWGILFAIMCFGFSRVATVVAGAIWGIVVWIGMFYVVLPLVGLGSMARAAPVGGAVLTHVIFGLALGFGFLPFQQPRREPLHRLRPRKV